MEKLKSITLVDQFNWTKEQIKTYIGIRWMVLAPEDLTAGQHDELMRIILSKSYVAALIECDQSPQE